jgi:hypothetical protein
LRQPGRSPSCPASDAHLLELFDDSGNALSIPRLSAIGFTPAVTFLRPSRKIAWARTVACRGAVAGEIGRLRRDFLHHLCAHVLDRIRKLDLLGDGDAVLGDGRCTELLVDDDVSALGPRVTLTASASWSTPRFSAARASTLKWSSLAAM